MFVLNMNEHMSEDCVFDYIIDDGECGFSDRIYKRGGKIFYIPWIRKHPFGYIKALWKILGEQKKQGTRVFYYQLFSMTKLLPAILAKVRGYKVILHAHNNGLQKVSKTYVLSHKIGKFIARFCGFIHFTNSKLSSDFMFGKGVKSELIYNAVDTDKFCFSPVVRDSVRDEIGCGDKTVVGFVGRLVRQKNPVFMIQVFAEFLKLHPNSELWIIGEGELQSQMEKEMELNNISSSVKWLGRREDVNRLMQGMDLLLQPSLFEGLGIVLIEAQATGLPVISSEDVVPHEAVASEKIQLLPLRESAFFWAEKGLMIIEGNKECERKSVSISKHFDITFEAKRLEELLKS